MSNMELQMAADGRSCKVTSGATDCHEFACENATDTALCVRASVGIRVPAFAVAVLCGYLRPSRFLHLGA